MLAGQERFKETLGTAYLAGWERGNGDVREGEALVQPTRTQRILMTSYGRSPFVSALW